MRKMTVRRRKIMRMTMRMILKRMRTLKRIRMMKMDPKGTTKKENTMRKTMMTRRNQIEINQETIIKLYSTRS